MVMESIASLALALIVVFVAAEILTNALEYLGERMRVSEGVSGSVLPTVYLRR